MRVDIYPKGTEARVMRENDMPDVVKSIWCNDYSFDYGDHRLGGLKNECN